LSILSWLNVGFLANISKTRALYFKKQKIITILFVELLKQIYTFEIHLMI